MKATSYLSAAIFVLSELSLISAKAIIHSPQGLRRSLDHGMREDAFAALGRSISRRDPQTNSPPISPTTSREEMNQTVSNACVGALAHLTTISNDAGISACYNILQNDLETGNFQADLRLYIAAAPQGDFVNIQPDNLMVGVEYPPSTSFSSLMKRSIRKRQITATMSEMQQYSLLGTFSKGLDLNKLNQTELMSLMIPQVTIRAVKANSDTPISTTIATTDTAYMVVGDFQGQFTSALVSPAMQKAAITQSSAFKLPGRTFGIFPTGLIVTCSWLFIFVLAYGVGTVGRWRHRTFYRRRQQAMARTGRRF